MNDRELVDLARAWPADIIDAAIIGDLADALERHVEETCPIRPDKRNVSEEER